MQVSINGEVRDVLFAPYKVRWGQAFDRSAKVRWGQAFDYWAADLGD